ncbi:12731_t:CDS:1 [Funneliformis mosseae]|uniref:12731_t:CDS:1 n=1 Tax=Funneliformis mosseae TaxID=27381 RepID=A0A9N9A5B8_FUNMO|nr:12731_t:CDS:1 [Funneliformis mosseae]
MIKFPYDEFENQLKSSSYQNLETIHVDCIQSSTMTRVIQTNGGHLRKILVNEYDVLCDTYFKDSLNLICTIYETCPLIEYLSISFSKTTVHFAEFENLLKACQKLKGLLIVINEVMRDELKSVEEENFESGERLARVLIKSAPVNLTEIRIGESFPYFGFKFSLEALDAFFDNWRGRKALSMFTCDPVYNSADYKEIINKYLGEGVVKKFICGGLKDATFRYDKV